MPYFNPKNVTAKTFSKSRFSAQIVFEGNDNLSVACAPARARSWCKGELTVNDSGTGFVAE
jgi:hypothetical protein